MLDSTVKSVMENDLEAAIATLCPLQRQAFVLRMMAKYGGEAGSKLQKAPSPLYAAVSPVHQIEWLDQAC